MNKKTSKILYYFLGSLVVTIFSYTWSLRTQFLIQYSEEELLTMIWALLTSCASIAIIVLYPFFGILSDNTRNLKESSKGRRKVWILTSFILMICISLISWLFSILSFNFIIILVFFTILINIGISIFDLNVTSLFSEMFITFEDRIKANSILLTLGIIFGLFLDLANFRTYLIIMTDRIIVSIIGIILLALSIVLGFVFYNNGINEKEIHLNDSKTPIKEMIKMPLKNRDFLLFLALNIIIPLGLYYSLKVNTSIYIETISIFNSNFWDYLLTIIQTSSLIFFIFIWRKRTETNDIKKNLKIGIIFIILSSIPLTFLSPFLYFISLILNSIGRAAYILFNFIFLSFLIDNNEIKTKSRHDATFFGIRNAISLIGGFLPLILSYFFLFLFGPRYDPSSEFTIEIFLQTTLMYILIALISLIVALLILQNFSVNSKRINEIESELNQIHQEKKKQL